MNQSKQASPLKEWVEKNNIDKSNQLIPKDVSLDVSEFRSFITERKKLLAEQLKKMVA